MIKIDRRKIGISGKSNYLILPKVWLDDLDLEAGDEVDVYRDEKNRLIIMPKEE